MKRFQFRFESLLSYRRHRRDQCRQLLAGINESARQLEQQIAATDDERQFLLQEMQDLSHSGRMDVDRISTRRYQAGLLQADLQQLGRQRESVSEQLELCRQALLLADRDVKSLEKLKERQLQEHTHNTQAAERRDMEEAWQASQLSGSR